MDEELKEILKIQETKKLVYKLLIEKNEFKIDSAEINNEQTPVTKPTERGGVYFTDTNICKIKAVTSDLSLTKYLSKAMLGPNTEFQDIILQTKYEKNNKCIKLNIITNLTNRMQNSNKIELNLVIKEIIRM